MNEISKILTPSDAYETGSHQSGISIPIKYVKSDNSIFPDLGRKEKNPRTQLTFIDHEDKSWIFQFIYYNNKYFNGTKNEYRLTGLSKYFKKYSIRSGNLMKIRYADENKYKIEYTEKSDLKKSENVSKLPGGWKMTVL